MLEALERISSKEKMAEKRGDRSLSAHVSDMKGNRDEKKSSTHVSWNTEERNKALGASRRVELPELDLNKNIGEFYHWIEEAESYSEFMMLSMKPKKKQRKMLLKHLNPVLRKMMEESIKESDDFNDGLYKLKKIFNERNPLQTKRWKHMKLRQKTGEDFFKWKKTTLYQFSRCEDGGNKY